MAARSFSSPRARSSAPRAPAGTAHLMSTDSWPSSQHQLLLSSDGVLPRSQHQLLLSSDGALPPCLPLEAWQPGPPTNWRHDVEGKTVSRLTVRE